MIQIRQAFGVDHEGLGRSKKVLGLLVKMQDSEKAQVISTWWLCRKQNSLGEWKHGDQVGSCNNVPQEGAGRAESRARERKSSREIFGFQFPGEAAGVRALNAPAFQVEAKATSSGLRRIQLTPSFLVTPTGPLSVPPLSEIDSRVEEAFPGTAFLMVISPQHHLPAAAAPARSAASGPRGPETGRRAGSGSASQAQLRMDWIASLHWIINGEDREKERFICRTYFAV
ncbi:uncharacterized protein LOC141584694 [Saimiri boliviensis]|uniref:uncharacterized protein LOC141584694 n=1 Tax=Saimiri boliviensis TaxID=27679 RepID=UPI003D7806CD